MPASRARSWRSLAVAIAGFVAIQAGVAAGAPRPPVGIPPAAIGDAGSYRITPLAVGDDGVQARLDFSWMARGVVVDRLGSPIPVDLLRLWSGGSTVTDAFAAGSDRLVQRTATNATPGSVSGPAAGVVPAGLIATSTYSTNTSVTDFPDAADCIFVNAAQGHAFPTTLAFRAGCFSAARETVLQQTGRQQIAGFDAVRFSNGSAPLSLWFAPGIPYPVRMTIHEGLTNRTLDLLGFRPGVDARVGGGPAQPPKSPLPVGRRTPWGIQDEGVASPFPLSRAYQDALAEPTFPLLRAYLALHPAAYAAAALGVTADHGTDTTYRWFVQLFDGRDPFCMNIEEVRWASAPPTHDYDGQMETCADIAVTADRGMRGGAPNLPAAPYGWPPPAQVPPLLPTARAALDRWAAFAPGATGAEYGFAITCQDARCQGVAVTMVAGQNRLVDRLDAGGPTHLQETWASNSSLLYLDASGAADRVVSNHDEGAQSARPTSVPSPVASPPIWGIVLSSWNPPEVATSAFVAVLAAVAYWVWPRFGATLFSRVSDEEAARHPRRALILAAVAAHPGIHHGELRRLTGIANGPFVHHSRVLMRAGRLQAHRVGGIACFFLGAARPAEARAAATVKAQAARRLAAFVALHPGASVAEIAALCDMPPSTARYHLHRMAEGGHLVRVGAGKGLRFFPRPDAAATAHA
ncbi:MAG: helix-turn-helix domain-containing protein [Thermoplasmatota archaeon]